MKIITENLLLQDFSRQVNDKHDEYLKLHNDYKKLSATSARIRLPYNGISKQTTQMCQHRPRSKLIISRTINYAEGTTLTRQPKKGRKHHMFGRPVGGFSVTRANLWENGTKLPMNEVRYKAVRNVSKGVYKRAKREQVELAAEVKEKEKDIGEMCPGSMSSGSSTDSWSRWAYMGICKGRTWI